MRILTTAFALSLLASTALANGSPPPFQEGDTITSTITSRNTNTAKGGSARQDQAQEQDQSLAYNEARERSVRFVFGGAPGHGSFSAGAPLTERVVVLNQGATLPFVGGGLHWDRLVALPDAAVLADIAGLRQELADILTPAEMRALVLARLARGDGEIAAAFGEASMVVGSLASSVPTITLTSARNHGTTPRHATTRPSESRQ